MMRVIIYHSDDDSDYNSEDNDDDRTTDTKSSYNQLPAFHAAITHRHVTAMT